MVLKIRFFAAVAACLVVAAGSLMAHDPHDPMQVVAISPNFAQDHTVLAATAGLTLKLGVMVVFKSTDGGVNWTVSPGLLNNNPLYALIFSPGYSQDQTVFAAGQTGLFMSTDGANSWTTLSSDSLVNMTLSPNFAKDNTLYVLTKGNEILRSTNRGKTLIQITAPTPLTAGISFIAVSPNFAADHTLLVGTGENGIFRSSNGGGKWTSVTSGLTLPRVTSLAFSPSFSTDQTAFAVTMGGGFLASTNGGVSWAKFNSGLTDTNATSLTLSPTYTQDSTLWVTTAVNGVFQSTNKGASWGTPVRVSRQLSTLTTVHYQTLAAYPGGLQFLGMFEGLWTSTNNGASWQYIDTCPTRFVRYINMSPNFPVDQTIFVSTYGSGNLWTTDAGATWTLQNNGMQAPYTDGSAISPNYTNDGMAFSGNHNGLQRTSDNGATWQMMTGPGQTAYPRGLAVSPNFANDKTVYIGTTAAPGHNTVHDEPDNAGAGLWISLDQGETWTISSLNGNGVPCIAFSPAFATDHTAFAGAQTGSLYKTTDSAVTWTVLTLPDNPNGMATVAVSPNYAVDQTVFAAALHGGIYRSTNSGSTWTLLSNTRTTRGLIIQFSPNYANDQTLFIGTIQYGLMESTNGGNTLSQVTSFPDAMVSALGVSPGFATDGTLFAAGYHGLFESNDAGATWTYLVTPARVEESRNITSNLQEPPTITYQGQWQMITPSAMASTNQYASTSENQDTAVFQFVGTGVDWVTLTGPYQGNASVTLDGTFQTTVNLNTSAPPLYQQTVWTLQGIPCAFHTLEITASPEVTQSVSLDAFDIWVNDCQYTTFGALKR